MTGKKRDHWGALASLLGMAPKAEPEYDLPEAQAEAATAATPPEPIPAPPTPPPPPSRPAPRAAKPAPPPKPAHKRRDHWGSVLGELGVQAPPEPEPEASVAFQPEVEMTATAQAAPEREVPPIEAGPSVQDRSHGEREARVPRGHGQRGRDVGRPPREERSRSAPPRRRFEDDIEIDAELDSGLRELWESHESEAPSPSRAETVDIDDLEIEDEVEEAAPASRGERPRDEEQGRGRRRRRRRGRRGSRDSAPSEGVEPARSRAAEDEALELDDLDLEDIGEEPVAEAPSRREPERAARPSRGGMHEEEQRTPGKRRRRRRRPTTERTDRAEDLDELDDEGLEGPASVDYLSESDRAEGHKRIPTWDDAVGAIVAANLELRSRHPQPPRREGRGRR